MQRRKTQITEGPGVKKGIDFIRRKKRQKLNSISFYLFEEMSVDEMAIRCFLSIRQLNKITSAGKF